jgi:DNA-binding NtrC family response regulator
MMIAEQKEVCTILTIGSEKSRSKKLHNELVEEGHIVVHNYSMNEAKRFCLFHKKISLIIIEKLPDGFDDRHLVTQLREVCGQAKILLAAPFSLDALQQACAAGFDEFLAMPVSKQQISAVLGKSQEKQEIT